MTKRNAIVLSVAFHAVLLTVLAIYLVVKPAPFAKVVPDETGPTVIAEWAEPPKVEPKPQKDPPPPIRHVNNDLPTTVEPIPLQANDVDPSQFAGPVNPETVFDPPSPSPISRKSPDYPDRAIRNEVSGKVVAVLTISPEGRVIDVVIESATPQGYFEKAAEKALKQWRYQPALVTNVSTNSDRRVRVEIAFNLEDAKDSR